MLSCPCSMPRMRYVQDSQRHCNPIPCPSQPSQGCWHLPRGSREPHNFLSFIFAFKATFFFFT